MMMKMMMIAVITIAPCLTRASTPCVTRATKRVRKTSTNYMNIILYFSRAHIHARARARTHIHIHTHTHTHTFCLNKWWKMAVPLPSPRFNLFRICVCACMHEFVHACVCVCVTVRMHVVSACACESQCVLAEERFHSNEKANICCSVQHGNQTWSMDLLTPLTGLKRERRWN